MRSISRTLGAAAFITVSAVVLTSCNSTDLPEPTASGNHSSPAEDVTVTEYITEEAPEVDPPTPESSPDSNIANRGDVCVTYDDGWELVALKDGTTCDVAISVMDQYRKADDKQGQALLWTAPNNWGCFGRFVIDGQDDLPENRRFSCGDATASGVPATEGSGGVALLKPGERDLL